MKDYNFVMECSACPEAYNIFDGTDLVAYFRYRHGYIEVYPYISDTDNIDWSTIIYEEDYGDPRDGMFMPGEFEEKIKSKVIKALNKYFSDDEKIESIM